MTSHAIEKLLTGVPELDIVLRGGLPKSRVHLLEGEPGAGEKTLGLKFLIEGLKAGDRALYVTISEGAEDLRSTSRSPRKPQLGPAARPPYRTSASWSSSL